MPSFLILLIFSSLAACQPVTVQRNDEGSVPVAVRVDDAAYWLEEWYRLKDLSEDQLEAALLSRQLEFKQAPGPRTRLRLALLLAQGPKPVRNQSEAYGLLKDLDQERASDSAKALAALLQQVIGEQRWAGDRLAEQRTKLKEAEVRIEELERQLQELTDIEQSIQQRN